MGNIGADYEIVVRDDTGAVVSQHGGECGSFVKNFVLLLEAGVRNSAVSVVDTSGASKSCLGFTCTASDFNNDSRHIIVGLGNAPVSADDYNLDEKISNSTLEYNLVNVTPRAPHIEAGYIKSRIATRSFINRTDTPITITEMGIVVRSSDSNVLILRDVLPTQTPVVVPVGGGVDISYTFKTAINENGSSFTLNFMRALVCSFNGSALVSVVDTSGTSRSINFGGIFPMSITGSSHYGIVVGTDGESAVGNEHSLGKMITPGSELGKLIHGNVSFSPTVVGDDGENIEFKAHRSLINMAEDPITIREVGLIARRSDYNILLARDVIYPVEIPGYDGIDTIVTIRTEL